MDRKQRGKLVTSYLEENIMEMCKPFDIEKNLVGAWIRAFHFGLPVIILFTFQFGNRYMIAFCVFFLIFMIILFILCNGCVLSRLETRLCGDDINPTDIFLKVANREINHLNRMWFTLYILVVYLLVCALIYYNRF